MLDHFNNPLDFQQPASLTANLEEIPYPKDALPALIKNAVDEAYEFIKAPYPILATSALGAISATLQSHFDVIRASRLQGPSSLFTLVIADSGERKSTCDAIFGKPIQIYEAEQAELAKPEIQIFKASHLAWEAEVAATKDAIKAHVKKSQNSAKANNGHYKNELEKLMLNEPKSPKVPKLIYSDTTPEALAYSLHEKWPSGSISSSEAGLVFGSHGMKSESLMKNLAVLNTLWDGGELQIERRTSESFRVKGARLSMSLQVQEPTIRAFFDASGGLARGTGFLARFLIAWPTSTQGNRPFTEAPNNWPSVSLFNQRLTQLLNLDIRIAEYGGLEPKLIHLSHEAKTLWVSFHDRIEGMLKTGGKLHEVKDVASKIADNAVRIATHFQMFCEPDSAEINAYYFNRASTIAEWHLNESRRFFGELALSPDASRAIQLDKFLVKYCKDHQTERVSKSDVLKNGPKPSRSKESLESTLKVLNKKRRAELVTDGKSQWIYVNPFLIEENAHQNIVEEV
jgi:putative DNA primase/helicase